jgi:hypothetical protein
MTVPYLPIKIEPTLTRDAFAIYLELCILWNKDIRDNSFNDFDRRWKQGQIDLLQQMLDEVDGIKQPTLQEIIFADYELINEMEE